MNAVDDQAGPFRGVRIVEVSSMIMGPGASVILSDLGAEVIKIEPLNGGDKSRGLANSINSGDVPNALFELNQHGKRSIGLDLATDAGHELLLRLVSRADVFLTTYLPQAREKLRLGVEELRAANPQLIYVRGSGWGQKGPEAHRPAYDFLAVWARSGVADRLTLPGGIPPIIPTGFFDFQGASVLAGATGAALFSRERTGEPSEVDVSLMNVGMWSLSADIAAAPWLPTERPQRVAPDNPVVDCYRTSDDRWLFFALLEADRYWPELVELLDDPDLRYDPRFATAATRAEHADACVGRLECIFASRTLEDWRERLSTFAGPWAHGATPLEIHDDEQALVNGFLTPFTTQHGDEVQVVTYPAQFNGRPTRFRGFTPEFGQQTEEILLELGLGWGDIVRLKDDGVVL